MRHAHLRVGIALALSTSLAISAVSATEATAAPQPPSQGTMLLAQDANAPIKVEGTILILFGNRIPLGFAAFGLLAAIGGAVGIAALATGNFGRSEKISSSSNGSSRKNPPKYGDRTAYDEDGDQAEINPQARGITTEDATLLFPKGASQVGQTVTIDDDALVALNLKEGDVLSIPPSPQFPVGQLAKIGNVETGDGYSRVVTKQAELSDIILQTDGAFDLAGAGVDYEFQTAEGVTIKKMSEITDFQQHSTTGTAKVFSVDFNPINLLEKLDPQFSKKLQKFEIKSTYTLEASVEVDRRKPDVNKTNIGFSNSLSSEISLASNEKIDPFGIAREIGSYTARFRFLAGAVPVFLSTSADLGLEGKLSGIEEGALNVAGQTTLPFEAQFDLSDKTISVKSKNPIAAFNTSKMDQSAGYSLSVAPVINADVTLYSAVGLNGKIALNIVASLLNKLAQFVGELKVIFSWSISGFIQPLTDALRLEKEFVGDEKTIFERSFPTDAQSEPSPSPSPSFSPTPPTRKDSPDLVKIEGVVKKLSRDQAARYGRIPNGEGPDSIYYVIELDGPTTLPAKSFGTFQVEERDGINQIAVGAIEYFPALTKPIDTVGIWKYYEGMRVSLEYDPDETYWNSGPRLPFGALQVGNYENLKLIPTGTCKKTDLVPNASKTAAEKFIVDFCDGTFARIGWPQSDDIRNLAHINGKWVALPADGIVKFGLARRCFTNERLDALSPPQAFRRNLPICKPEDLGYFPTY